MAAPGIVVAGATRAHPEETANGDAWTHQVLGDGRHRLTLIDALGHGPEAEVAALTATHTLERLGDVGPVDAIHACHQALRGTRGAALAMACLDLPRGHLTFAGVGNVEAYLWTGERVERPISYRGIVGASLPRLRSFDLSLGADWLLLLHSDGVRARFDLTRLEAFIRRDPRALADAVVAEWARTTDDATVCVACLG